MTRRTIKLPRAATLLALLLALALAAPLLGGCSSAPPKPTKAELEAQQRAAEAKRKAEEEQRRLAAEAAAKAKAERERKEVQEAFGPVGTPPPAVSQAAPEAPAAPTAPGEEAAAPQAAAPAAEIPFDKAVPPLPPEPTVRVVVLGHGVPSSVCRRVAVQIGTYERVRIEARLGKALKITYVAETGAPLARPSEIHYRKHFLLAAQSVAMAMADQQAIGPMTPDELRQDNVDLVIHIGKHYR